MTFNIRYGTAPDSVNSWTHRKAILLQVIRDCSPDIIGLQEALRFQINEIREVFPEYGEIGVGRDDGKSAGEYSAILYRSPKFSVVKQETFWFSRTPSVPGSKQWGNEIPRICTWAIFRGKGVTFGVYNLHLDHQSETSRKQSTEMLTRRAKENDKLPVIIMGDFNAGEQSEEILGVQSGGFSDSFRSLHPSDSLVGTYHGFTGNQKGEKIDYVFTNRHARALQAAIIRFQSAGRHPSDHFPVSAVIRLLDTEH